jgi:hypothetical protein
MQDFAAGVARVSIDRLPGGERLSSAVRRDVQDVTAMNDVVSDSRLYEERWGQKRVEDER